jgi:hypothetical protein
MFSVGQKMELIWTCVVPCGKQQNTASTSEKFASLIAIKSGKSCKEVQICNQCNKASTHHNHDMTISQENYDWKFETITNLHEHYVKGIQISVRRNWTDRIPYGQ